MKPSVFIRDATGLVRQLSAKDVLMFNLLNMGIMWPMVFVYFAGSVYQGVNIPLTVLLAFPPNVAICLLYYYLTVAFPRTGGDYVWMSRLIHPAVGFMMSFTFVLFITSSFGSFGAWVISYGLSTMYANLGIATGNAVYTSVALSLATPTNILIGDIVMLAVTIAATAFGLKNAFRIQWLSFVAAILGIAIFVWALLSSSHAAFKANFDTLSGTTYDGILDSASKAGFVTTFTFGGTLLGTFFSFLNYLGFNWSAYIGGEVRQSEKSQLIGMMGSLLIFTGIVFMVFAVPFYIMGGQFINAAALLAGSGNSAYTLPSPPVTSYLMIFANPNPVIAIMVPLTLLIAVFGALVTVMLAAVRVIFAWSFDGVIPTKFCEVSEATGSPKYAIALASIMGFVYVLINVFASNIVTLLAYSTSGVYFIIAVVGLAGILLPYRRKDLFTSTPPRAQQKVWGVPVVAIVGGITLVTGLIVAYMAASPAFTGSPVNPEYLAFLVLTFVVGFVIYKVSSYLNKTRGFDLNLRFKEIPPE